MAADAMDAEYTGNLYEADHIFATAKNSLGVEKMMEHFVTRARR